MRKPTYQVQSGFTIPKFYIMERYANLSTYTFANSGPNKLFTNFPHWKDSNYQEVFATSGITLIFFSHIFIISTQAYNKHKLGLSNFFLDFFITYIVCVHDTRDNQYITTSAGVHYKNLTFIIHMDGFRFAQSSLSANQLISLLQLL